ncbi:hypothetical protein ACOMHN_062520 [Nucella lapillus]
MNLCGWQAVSPVRRGGSHGALPASVLCSVLCLPHSMCLARSVQGACAALSLSGRVLWVCLLLDVLYLACVDDAAPLPLSDSASEFVNKSDTSGSISRSSLLSFASHLAAPSAALLPSSLSLSSSKSVDDKRHGNVSWNETVDAADSDLAANSSSETLSSGEGVSERQAVTTPTAGKARREFPLALVVASATAAVSILLFFCLSYLWHTRQLDRRAQKLAIRLAAEVNTECTKCRPVATYRLGSCQDSGSDSGGEGDSRVLRIPVTVLDELDSLNEEEEEGEEEEDEGEDGSRRKAGGVGRTLGNRKGGSGRGRGSRRSSNRSSRKWSGHSSSAGLTRSSLVTDQEILTHFASRRHSTFFI